MKKIWMMLLMVSAVFAFSACSDDDDNKEPQNPVSNVTVPATAKIGTEITITGTGFTTTAKFNFKNAEGSTEATNVNIMGSGATLTVPMSLKEGVYTVELVQDGNWDLGSIELEAAAMPIVSLVVPTEVFTGQALVLGGSNFNETSKIYLVNEAGNRVELTTTDYTNGLTCTIPSGTALGDYSLVLAQDGGEWTLEEKIALLQGKRITKISFVNDYSDFGIPGMEEWLINSFEIVYTDNIATQFALYEGGVIYSIQNADNQTTLAIQDIDESVLYDGYMSKIILTQNSNTIISGSIDYISLDEPTESENYSSEWIYTSNYLTEYNNNATIDDYSRKYVSGNNNIISIENKYGSTTFSYDNALTYSRPGIDIASLIYQVTALNTFADASWYYAAMTGKIGEKSAQLPTAMDEEVELTYDFEDGYIYRVYFDAEGIPAWLEFEYENIE